MNLDILRKLMERIPKVDLRGYPVEFIQALIALFYWTGLRRSEILGDTGHKWKLKSGEIKRSKPFSGLLKENMWLDKDNLYIFQEARARHKSHKTHRGYINRPLKRGEKLPCFQLKRQYWTVRLYCYITLYFSGGEYADAPWQPLPPPLQVGENRQAHRLTHLSEVARDDASYFS